MGSFSSIGTGRTLVPHDPEIKMRVVHGCATVRPTPTDTPMRTPFHLAVHVRDLDEARAFSGTTRGCAAGRSSETWVDFDVFGHQLSLHLGAPFANAPTGKVGNHMVPMPLVGVVLHLPDWKALAARLDTAGTDWVIAPSVPFEGQPAEQRTMFFRDPSGNPIDVKGLARMEGVFAA